LDNWGHAGDFDVEAFFGLWESVGLGNYVTVRDFHPLNGPIWPSLKLASVDFLPGEPCVPS